MGNYKGSQRGTGLRGSETVRYESVVPNPKLKLLEQMREVMRLKQLIRLVPTTLTLPGFSCC